VPFENNFKNKSKSKGENKFLGGMEIVHLSLIAEFKLDYF